MGKQEHLTKTQKIMDMFEEQMNRLRKQQNVLFSKSLKIVVTLFVILVLVFIVFSIKEFGSFRLDENSTRLLWIIVIIDIVGLVWVVTRASQQLKRYRICIKRLETLLFKVSVKNEYSKEELNEKGICNEIQSIMNVWEHDK